MSRTNTGTPPTSMWDSMHASGAVSLLVLTNMFTEILGLRDGRKSGESCPSIHAQAHSVLLHRKLLLNASLPQNETHPVGLAFCEVQVPCIGIVSNVISPPLPLPLPLPRTLASQFNIITVFTFLTFASNRSPRKDCFPFDSDSTRIQLAPASISRPMALFPAK
jgi:hypothetical protein